MRFLLAITSDSLRETATSALEPGEQLLAVAHGLSMPPRETVRKVLWYGLFVFGAIVLLFLRDKVILALTSRRVLIFTLTERYGHVIGTHAFPVADVRGFAHEKGRVYHELSIDTAAKPYRFLFFPSPFGIPDNGGQVLEMDARLGHPGAPSATPAPAAAPEAAAPTGGRLLRRTAVGCLGTVGVILAIGFAAGAYQAWRSGGVAAEARAALARNDLAAAADGFRRAIDLAGRYTQAALLHELAAVELAREKPDAALECLRDARRQDPDYRAPAELAAKLAELRKRLDE